MFKKELLLVLGMGIGFIGIFNAQEIKKERKKTTTTRVSEAPIIDGILNDAAWKDAELLTDFITFRPDNGKKLQQHIKQP